jgi:hypothetical protein
MGFNLKKDRVLLKAALTSLDTLYAVGIERSKILFRMDSQTKAKPSALRQLGQGTGFESLYRHAMEGG